MLKLLAPLAITLGGSLLSNLLMPSRKDNKPPERQNFQDAGAGPLNWGVGTFWCTPKLIAKSPVRDNSKGKQSRKKGGGKPRCSAVYVICKGPIQGVTRILANGKVMYDIRPASTPRNFLSGMSSAWRIVDGTQTSPDSALISILGAPLAASLNGWALLVFENLQVKDSGGDVPTFECEVLRYPNPDFTPIVNSLRSSAYYSPYSKTVVGKVVQCQDGIERLFSVTTDARVYGASISYQEGAGIPNVAGDIALEAEGQVIVETSTGPIIALPYSRALGSWYYTGDEVSPGLWEVARQSEISPYVIWDTSLAGETYSTDPDEFFGDFYPVPSVPTEPLAVSTALHNQPLTLNDIHKQLLADFSGSVGQWYEQLNGAIDPRGLDEAVFYGWTIDGQGTIFDSYSRLLASLGIDLVDNYSVLSYVSDNNRTLTRVQDDWVSRKYNDETGDEEPFYTYEIMPNSVSPDEVRLMFRDAGRDGEESLAYYRSPLFSETQNSETISTNAVMAFATAQTLAFRLFARAATRGKKYTVRLNYRAFGSIDVGSLIQFRVVDCDLPIWDLATNTVSIDRRGWVAERVVTLLVSEVQIDELFNLEIVGYEYLTNTIPYPTIGPGDLVSEPDGFPNEILMQANVVNTPIWNGSTNTLQKFYQAIPLAPNTEVITPCETSMSTLGDPYVVLSNDTPGDIVRTGSLTGGAPILGVIDEITTLTFNGTASEGFGSVSEASFLAGQGTWIRLGSEVIRAKNVTWTGTEWQASYLLRGLLGTAFASIAVSLPVTLLSKLKSKDDVAQDLLVTRDVRTYAQIQAIDSSPAKPFTQNGFTAVPYAPTNLGDDLQPNGDRILYWMGHGLSNGNAINGQKPLNIAIGQSYTITLIGASGTFTSTTQDLTLTSTQLGAATGFTVRQNGDFNLFSPISSQSF